MGLIKLDDLRRIMILIKMASNEISNDLKNVSKNQINEDEKKGSKSFSHSEFIKSLCKWPGQCENGDNGNTKKSSNKESNARSS